MKKFVFKLQSVLNHRQKKEDILKKELAEIKLLYEREKRLLEELKNKLSDLRQGLKTKQRSNVDPADVTAHSNFINRVEREIEVQIARVTDLAGEVRKAQERLIHASKDKKVLEKLQDKKYEEYKQETERVEQGIIDEIATVRHRVREPFSFRSGDVE